MKTALQELIEWLDNSTIIQDEFDRGIIKDKATELLEKEREQIENAHANGIHDASACINGEKFKTSQQYFNETYNEKM